MMWAAQRWSVMRYWKILQVYRAQLWHCAAELEDAGTVQALVAAFQVEAKRKNACVLRIHGM